MVVKDEVVVKRVRQDDASNNLLVVSSYVVAASQPLLTVRVLLSLVKTRGPRVLFLMETKLDSHEMESV